MTRNRLWIVVSLFFIASSQLRADEWPVKRGPARDPLPYRYDARVLKTIPKEFLDDSAACVLYSGTTHLIEPDGTVEAISHEITRLNSRKGIEKLGEYRSISYDPAYEKLTLNEACVIKADGKDALFEPAFALDLFGVAALAAIAAGEICQPAHTVPSRDVMSRSRAMMANASEWHPGLKPRPFMGFTLAAGSATSEPSLSSSA